MTASKYGFSAARVASGQAILRAIMRLTAAELERRSGPGRRYRLLSPARSWLGYGGGGWPPLLGAGSFPGRSRRAPPPPPPHQSSAGAAAPPPPPVCGRQVLLFF